MPKLPTEGTLPFALIASHKKILAIKSGFLILVKNEKHCGG